MISAQSSQCSCPRDGHTRTHQTPIPALAPPPFPIPNPHLLRTAIQPRRRLRPTPISARGEELPRPHPLGSFNCSAPARHHPRQLPGSPPSRGYGSDSPAATDGSPVSATHPRPHLSTSCLLQPPFPEPREIPCQSGNRYCDA